MKQLETRWSQAVKDHPDQVLTEYPRPQMQRESYVNLNGLWDYAITGARERPEQYMGKILVPFSPEAPLSGVGRQVQPEELLWYRRTLPEEVVISENRRWLLHFGAVDQFAAVYVNGHLVGKHLGGYLPFTMDVTEFLKNGRNTLIVAVRDFSDQSYHSRGKQKLKRGGMYYTAQSGIWQTVWMEQVPEHYIEEVEITPLYDDHEVQILVREADGSGNDEKSWMYEDDERAGQSITITIKSDDMQTLQVSGKPGEPVRIPLLDMHSWSPEDPFLYYLYVQMEDDVIGSYFAMRKISMEKDRKGILRTCLNNEPYFQKGVLDQGYWPDGLYTAPCDEAMIFDIKEMKRLGFNMLRKHIKIEPDRWYYHCDRLGMLVWQDMVCGGEKYKSWYVTYMATAFHKLNINPKDSTYRLLARKDKRGREQFADEMQETIYHLYNHPSIVTWVIFNEGWGQFDARKMTELARQYDSTRLCDQASGWFDQKGGDYKSIHEYFFHLKVKPEARIVALTEYGGYSWHVEERSMCEKVYGYRIYNSKEELSQAYAELHEKEILPNIAKGLSVTTYTQVSDIEDEVNGFYTYDREMLKMSEDVVKECNDKIEKEMNKFL